MAIAGAPDGLGLASAWLMQQIGLLRFDMNIQAFEFKPSIGVVAKDLDRLADAIGTFRVPLTSAIKLVIIPSIRKNFDVGGRPPWEDLAEGTVKRRFEEGWRLTEQLVRTGRLRRAATSLNIWSVGKLSATVRDLPADAWYGKVHQAGLEGRGAPGKWFGPYAARARKILGPEASNREVNKLGMSIFDKRVTTHGVPPAGEPNIPARPFILFQEEDIDRIQRIFYEWLDEKIATVGHFRPGVG